MYHKHKIYESLIKLFYQEGNINFFCLHSKAIQNIRNALIFIRMTKYSFFRQTNMQKAALLEKNKVPLPSNKLYLIKRDYYANDSLTPKTMEPPLHKFVSYKQFDPSSSSQEKASFELSTRKPINLT